MIVHVPKTVDKRIKACVLMDPELGNMSMTEALGKEGLKMSRSSWSHVPGHGARARRLR